MQNPSCKKQNHNLFAPKRLVYGDGDTVPNARTENVQNPSNGPTTPEVRRDQPKKVEEMSMWELEAELSNQQGKTEQAANVLLQRLTNDTALLDFYKRQATPQQQPTPQLNAPEAQPTQPQGTPPAPGTPAPGVTDQLAEGLSKVGTWFQDTYNSISGSNKSPEQKAAEHKKRIIDRIQVLVTEGKITNVPPEVLANVRRDIESQYNEVANKGPKWTEGNTKIAAVALGVFLINWWRKGSLWEGAISTLEMGAVFAGGGLAVYALKTGLPGTAIGNFAEKIWNNIYAQVPGVTQYQQQQTRERQGNTLRNVETEEATKVLRLRDLVALYRRGVLTVRDGGTFRSQQDMLREIQNSIGVLKNSNNPRLKEFMSSISLSDQPDTTQINTLLAQLKQFELAEAFKGADGKGTIPEGVMNVLTNKNTLLNSIDRSTNDVPREGANVTLNFRDAVEGQTNKSIDKVQKLKERKNAIMRRMTLTLLSYTRWKQEKHDEVDKFQQQMQAMQGQQNVDPQAVQQTIRQLSSTLGDADRTAQEFQAALSAGNSDEMFDRMVNLLNSGKDAVLAGKEAGMGRWEKLDALSDNWLLIESLQATSSQIPEADLTSNDFMQLASQAVIGMGSTGMMMMALGLGGTLSVASGAIRMATSPLRMMSWFASGSVEEMLPKYRELVQGQSWLRAYGGTMLVSAAAFGLSAYHFWQAKEMYTRATQGVEGTARLTRGAQAGVELLAGSAEVGVGINALRRISDIRHLREGGSLVHARTAVGNLMALGIIEGGRFVATNILDQLATSQEIENIKFANLTTTDLLGLMVLYNDTFSSDAFQWIKTKVTGLADISDPLPNQRPRMRERILREFARRNNVPGQDIDNNFLPFIKKYSNENYNIEPQRDTEILTYAIVYSQLAKTTPPTQGQARSNDQAPELSLSLDYPVMKQRLDGQRIRIEAEGLKAQRDVMDSINTLGFDPEIRFVMESFGRNYEQIMRFYQLCRAAIANTATSNSDRSQLEQYARYADFYIHNYLGFQGPVRENPGQQTTYQAVLDLINAQKNLEHPENNRLLHYYAESYVRGLITDQVKSISTDQKQNLINYLVQQKGVDPAKAQRFGEIYFTDSIYSKGSADGLLHRKKLGINQAFLAGEWRDLSEPETTTSNWLQDTSRDYVFYSKVVNGLRYHYLVDFNCFITQPPTQLPAKKADFFGKYDNGMYTEPLCNINDVKTLTVVDVPQTVYAGLVELLKTA